MSTPNTEPTVEPVTAVTPEQTVSIQIVEEPVVKETAAPDENTATPETTAPAVKSEEEVSAAVTDEAPIVATKSTETKRRTIFNPFAKASKKEETVPADESPAATTTTSEEKPKKATKAFGTFFSRSKSSPKVAEEESASASAAGAGATESEAATTTELPQIEQLQPIETDNIVTSGSEDQEPTIKEAVAEIVESVEEQATEVSREVEQATTHLTTAVTNKRQSFISKLFGGKNKKAEVTKEVEEHANASTETAAAADNATPAAEEPAAEAVEVEEQVEAAVPEKIESHQRPSSPLGRLTELFTSKKNNKKAASTANSPTAPPKEEETPTVLVTEVEEDTNANITNAVPSSNVTTPVVTASA